MDGPWVIHEGGVGGLTVGGPIPSGLLGDAEDRYFARYIADGQPFEGFVFDDPPLMVGVRGPWTAFARSHGLMDPPAARFRGPATRKARAGLPVRVILIDDPALRTAGGVGVGSTLAELEAAHGAPNLRNLPPTLGDDGCSAELAALPGVSFVFATCDAARDGEAVVRVDVWAPEG
ncbi:MAG: hypothetical protein GY898_31515 [Proteobacteria bacterium]|nr:hypothetical protein [Pseudomonadota bacterium]